MLTARPALALSPVHTAPHDRLPTTVVRAMPNTMCTGYPQPGSFYRALRAQRAWVARALSGLHVAQPRSRLGDSGTAYRSTLYSVRSANSRMHEGGGRTGVAPEEHSGPTRDRSPR